jgi:hypothetical protein
MPRPSRSGRPNRLRSRILREQLWSDRPRDFDRPPKAIEEAGNLSVRAPLADAYLRGKPFRPRRAAGPHAGPLLLCAVRKARAFDRVTATIAALARIPSASDAATGGILPSEERFSFGKVLHSGKGSRMKTLLSLGCVSLVSLAVAVQPSPAQAGGVAVGVTVPVGPGYAPAPVYPAPTPYYYGAPAYYGPPAAYVAPAPVVVRPGVLVYGRYGRPYYYRRARWW